MGHVKSIAVVAGLALLTMLPSGPIWAQAVSGSQVSGLVSDASGGALPGAEVTITRVDTGQSRTVISASDGGYTIPSLAPGPYQLRVALDGFTTYVRDGIVLQVGTNPQVNVTLDVGAMSEQVTVTANANMVETHSTGIGQVVDNQRVVDMPLNGRQATELIFLAGLATSTPGGDMNTNKNYPTVTISVAGGQATGMTYIMDGGTHNDPFNNLNLPTPFPDALQEFKVETSALPARYGHHSASAVNLVTKSGTNEFNGAAFEFVRNYRFNARNAFALERDSLKRNQFGGVLGGPIVKEKLFFFGGYQGEIERSNPSTTIRFIPTPAMLAGDFTAFASPACNAGRQTTLRGEFVNNRIDPSRLSPIALRFAQYLPTQEADPCGRVQFGIPNNDSEHQSIARIDYSLTSEQSVLVRYLYAVYENPATFDGRNVLTLSRTGQRNQAHSVVLGHNWLVSDALINSVRVTYNKTINDRPLPEYFNATDLGSNIYSPLKGYVGISVTGNGFSVGSGGTNPGYFNSDSFQFANDTDFVRGKHHIAFGGNWIRTKIETLNNRPTNGAFTFNGQTIGLPLADFMVGRPSNFLQGNPVYDYDDHDYVGAYVQDEWRVMPKLSINAGVRWEPFIPLRNTFGWVSHFDKQRFDRGLKSEVYPKAPAGLIFPGDDGYPGTAASDGRIGQFAPRLGAIWTPGRDNTTSVRAAWGMFFDTPPLFFNTRFANNPPWGAQIAIPNPAGGWADPYLGYPGGNPFPELNTNWKTAAFPAFGLYVNAPMDLKPPVMHQWNLSVQRQVGEYLVAASYLGNRTVHLWRAIEINPAVFGPGATTGNTSERRLLIRQNPVEGQYYGTIGQLDDSGRGKYNALLLSAQRRLKNGMSVLSNWTISKCMSDPVTLELATGPMVTDPNNPELDYSHCASDRRHVVNVSVVARTPQFENGVLNAVLGDWQLSPLVRWQSGDRSSVTTGVDNALSGTGGQRAVQILDDPYGDKSAANYLNRAAFTAPAAGTYSDLRPFSIVNPTRFQNDLAIMRRFRAPTGQTFQFRWEIFNVINHVNLDAPVTALNSATFGQILSAGDPRIMQFALKMEF